MADWGRNDPVASAAQSAGWGDGDQAVADAVAGSGVPAVNPRIAREGVAPVAPAMGMMESLGRGVEQGITLGFGDEMRGVAEAGAGTGENIPGVALVRGLWRLINSDPDARAEYERVVAEERMRNEESSRTNPKTAFVGEMMGGVAIPAGGLAAQGARGAAKVGALIGGAYGVGTADDTIASRVGGGVTGAALGGVVGAATPYVVRGIAAAGRGMRDIGASILGLQGALSAEKIAAQRVAATIEADRLAGQGLPVPQMAQQIQTGGPAVMADFGGTATQRLAREVSDISPEANRALKKIADERSTSQVVRLEDNVRSLFGGTLEPWTERELLKQGKKTAANPLYDLADQQSAAMGGVWTPTLARMMESPTMQPAIREAIKRSGDEAVLQGGRPFQNPFIEAADGSVRLAPGVKPGVEFWNIVQQVLRDGVEGNKVNAPGVARNFTRLREQLLGEVDAAVPAFKSARRTWAHFSEADDAYDAGRRFVAGKGRDGKDIGVPQATAILAKASADDKERFARGFAAELIGKIKEYGVSHDLTKKVFLSSPASRERIEAAVGRQRANEIEAALHLETVMQGLKEALGGSQTSRNMLAQILGQSGTGAAGGLGGYLAGGDIGSVTAGGALAILLKSARKRNQLKIDQRIADKVGELLTSQDPAVINNAIRYVATQPGLLGALRSAADAVGGVISMQAPGTAGVVAGQAAAPAQQALRGIAPGVLSPKAEDEGQRGK